MMIGFFQMDCLILFKYKSSFIEMSASYFFLLKIKCI